MSVSIEEVLIINELFPMYGVRFQDDIDVIVAESVDRDGFFEVWVDGFGIKPEDEADSEDLAEFDSDKIIQAGGMAVSKDRLRAIEDFSE